MIKLKKEDDAIIEKLFCRDEEALTETEDKYGPMCRKIAYSILGDYEDANECVNTAFYKLWNAIPPARPLSLKAYLCKVVRSVAFSMRKKNSSAEVYLTELSDFIPDDNGDAQKIIDSAMLTVYLNEFLKSQKDINRRVFILRYYYNLSIDEISASLRVKSATVKTKLFRMREELKKLLESNDYKI